QTRQLSAHAIGLIELRERLIEDHRHDQNRAAYQLGLYGTTRTVKEHFFYDEETVTLPELPDELTDDLPLPYPQEEVNAALASADLNIGFAELIYGKNAAEFKNVQAEVEQMTAPIRPAARQ